MLQSDAPYRGHLSFVQIVRQSGCVNLIDSHASLQSSRSCKLNTVAWVVGLTYLHVVVKCKSLLGGHGKARCTVNKFFSKRNFTALLDVYQLAFTNIRNSFVMWALTQVFFILSLVSLCRCMFSTCIPL